MLLFIIPSLEFSKMHIILNILRIFLTNNLMNFVCLFVCFCIKHFSGPKFSSGFPSGPVVKNLLNNARDPGLIPGSRRFHGSGNGNPPQYCCLDNFTNIEPCQLQSMGSQRVGHNLASKQQNFQVIVFA